MADIFRPMEKNSVISVYRILVTVTLQTTRKTKLHPYSQLVSGLKANVRSLSPTERQTSGIRAESKGIVAVVNFREGIAYGDYVEFAGTTYQIKSADPLDFSKRDLKLTAESVIPQKTDSEEWTE